MKKLLLFTGLFFATFVSNVAYASFGESATSADGTTGGRDGDSNTITYTAQFGDGVSGISGPLAPASEFPLSIPDAAPANTSPPPTDPNYLGY